MCALSQVSDFDPAKATGRWLFLPADMYPDEAEKGHEGKVVAGWRAQIIQSKNLNKKNMKFVVQMLETEHVQSCKET